MLAACAGLGACVLAALALLVASAGGGDDRGVGAGEHPAAGVTVQGAPAEKRQIR